MMKVTATALVAAAVMAGTTDAISANVYSDAECKEKLGGGTASSGSCIKDDGTSTKVTCASSSKDSTWSYQSYGNADCTAPAASTINGTGDGCTSLGGIGYIEINCAGGCFSGDALVTLHGGNTVKMSQLNTGDRVLSSDDDGNLFYDTVFRVTHWDDQAYDNVVRLTTESGNVVELTHNHYVHANALDKDSLTLAADVVEGDVLYVTNEEGDVVASPVASVETVKASGLYNVHTLSSNIVVNGVVSTHYSTESTYGSKNSAVPAWNQLMSLLSPIIGTTDVKPQQ